MELRGLEEGAEGEQDDPLDVGGRGGEGGGGTRGRTLLELLSGLLLGQLLGENMLAVTLLENPDKRSHIVHRLWGVELPSDPAEQQLLHADNVGPRERVA